MEPGRRSTRSPCRVKLERWRLPTSSVSASPVVYLQVSTLALLPQVTTANSRKTSLPGIRVFDVAALARRVRTAHPYRARAAFALGLTIVGVFVAFAVAIILFSNVLSPSELLGGYVWIGVSFLVDYIVLAVSLQLYRDWAPAPVEIRIVGDGLEFGLESGRTMPFPWHGGSATITVRLTEPNMRVLPEERIRMELRSARYNPRYFWRSRIPNTFVTEPALSAICEAAQSHRVPLSDEEFLPRSLINGRFARAKMLTIGPG